MAERKAVVDENGEVVNVILVDPESDYEHPHGHDLVDAPKHHFVEPGAKYDRDKDAFRPREDREELKEMDKVPEIARNGKNN